jgi:hypothetical protein
VYAGWAGVGPPTDSAGRWNEKKGGRPVKRISTGIVGAVLMFGMLPGVASAGGLEVGTSIIDITDPKRVVYNSGLCIKAELLENSPTRPGTYSIEPVYVTSFGVGPYVVLTITDGHIDSERMPNPNAGFVTGFACSADGEVYVLISDPTR